MEKLNNHLLKAEETPTEALSPLQRQFEQYLAPECELPKDYQKSIDKDYADKWWEHQDEKFKDTENPIF